MKNTYGIAKLTMICTVAALTGCAGTPTKQFETSKKETWNLDNAPILSEIIKNPIADFAAVAENATLESFSKSHKQKFESDEAFKARVAAMKPIKDAFIVKPLRTYECTKYDFNTKTYNISCEGFRSSDVLATKSKTTGKGTLANAYTSRDVEYVDSYEYRLSINEDAVSSLNISSEDAQKIDNDLMIGVLVKIKSADYDLGGCSESDVEIVNNKICTQIAFKTGLAVQTRKYVVNTEAILESVIFRKSNNRVLSHSVYSLKQ